MKGLEKIYDIKQTTIEQLRNEDKALIDFAERMGYTNKEPSTSPPLVKQEFLILNNKDISDEDKKTILEVEKLTPIERNNIINEINKTIRKENEQTESESTERQ